MELKQETEPMVVLNPIRAVKAGWEKVRAVAGYLAGLCELGPRIAPELLT